MGKRLRLLAFALAAAIAGGAVLVFAVGGQAAQATAALTLFTGRAQLEHARSSHQMEARTGTAVAQGDTIRTGRDTRVALQFPDGSISRLDSETLLEVRQLAKLSSRSDQAGLYQATGRAWYHVTKLVGGASFRVDAPNNTTAEVRGTEFAVIVGPPGIPAGVETQVWKGTVEVTAQGHTVAVGAGFETVTLPGQGPGTPTALGAAQRNDPWTLFNLGADQVSGRVVNVLTGTLSQGESSTPQPAGADGTHGDVQFGLAWPGSQFQLTAYGAGGAVAGQTPLNSPPAGLVVRASSAAALTVVVSDLESIGAETWVVVVAVSTPAPPGAPGSPGSSYVPSASATPRTSGSPGATPSPGTSPSPGASPSSPSPSQPGASQPQPEPTSTPVAGPSATPAPPPPPTPSVTPLAITTASALPGATVGGEYNVHINASGGTQPYRWAVAGGALPPGLGLAQNQQSGEITGKPASAGTYSFTLRVTDSTGAAATRVFSLVVK